MFVIVFAYRAKPSEEDAILAIFENWQSDQQLRARGYLSAELLRSVEDPGQFIAVMRFVDQEAAHALTHDPEQDVWYQRIVSLAENAPIINEYTGEWP
jgi:heme-degrading monooxygenase HmoA